MGFTFTQTIPAMTVFLQGLLSFFSPCVLPLLPLYLGYLSGGGRKTGANGETLYHRGIILRNTVFFVLGISFALFLLGLGFSAAGQFFRRYETVFNIVCGLIVLLFGLYQLRIFGMLPILSGEKRLPLRLDKLSMNPLTALIMGFCFSFSWTPCIGPTLTGVLMMTASAGTQARGYLLILVYALGFIIPFLAVGLFTGTVLSFFKKHQHVVRYTTKVGGVLLIIMGIMIMTGWMSHFSGLISSAGAEETVAAQQQEAVPAQEDPAVDETMYPIAPDFTLKDQYGITHTLSDYKGKTVFINFWSTWCGFCIEEMPEIQALYEELGKNREDVIILGMVNPYPGADSETKENIIAFLKDKHFTFPVLFDETGLSFYEYAISSFPTTFLIRADGRVMGYAPGAMRKSMMLDIINQTNAACPPFASESTEIPQIPEVPEETDEPAA